MDIESVSIYPYPPKMGHRVSLLVDLTLSKTPSFIPVFPPPPPNIARECNEN